MRIKPSNLEEELKKLKEENLSLKDKVEKLNKEATVRETQRSEETMGQENKTEPAKKILRKGKKEIEIFNEKKKKYN